jgi:hypothetical protein
MIALDLAVAGPCRHVRRMVVMMMAMSQLGHDENNLARLPRRCQNKIVRGARFIQPIFLFSRAQACVI